jgi:hypothetical protein
MDYSEAALQKVREDRLLLDAVDNGCTRRSRRISVSGSSRSAAGWATSHGT